MHFEFVTSINLPSRKKKTERETSKRDRFRCRQRQRPANAVCNASRQNTQFNVNGNDTRERYVVDSIEFRFDRIYSASKIDFKIDVDLFRHKHLPLASQLFLSIVRILLNLVSFASRATTKMLQSHHNRMKRIFLYSFLLPWAQSFCRIVPVAFICCASHHRHVNFICLFFFFAAAVFALLDKKERAKVVAMCQS